MIPLPIDAELPRILEAIRQSRSAVIVAEPGAGKTTRVPPAILRAGLLPADAPNLIMLQPRRVAARLSAARIAEEQNWTLGKEVGYQIRFERRMTNQTRLRILTEGILTRQLLDDSYLPSIGCVILDEFHERNLHSDISIAMLRELRQSVRPNLILIVMSATLDAEPVAKFLDNAPIIRSPGRTFPIDIQCRNAPPGQIERSVADAVHDALATPGGDMLVFLPGAEEIRRTQNELHDLHDVDVFPLHGSLPVAEQDRALRPSNRRKIILSTNIAETSLTIPGVDTVIDTGLQRLPTYDSNRGMDRLELRRISKASATQRAGRAARTAPGRAIRLWTAKQHEELDDFQLPEVQRVDLSSTILALHAWGAGDAAKFDWFERPSDRSIAAAESLLELLGAIRSRQKNLELRTQNLELFEITDLGRRMLALPVPVRLARLLLDARDHGLADEAATIAALLSERDSSPRRGPAETMGDSDLLLHLDKQLGPHIAKSRDQLLRILTPSPGTPARGEQSRTARVEPSRNGEGRGGGQFEIRNPKSQIRNNPHPNPPPEYQGSGQSESTLLKLLLLAYPDRVVRRRDTDPNTGLMVGGVGVRLAKESIVRRGDFYLAIDVQADERSRKSEALVRMASRIERDWLDELFPQFIQTRTSLIFEESRGKVIAKKQTFYRDLLLTEIEEPPSDLVAAGKLLGESLRQNPRKFFDADEDARQWLARLELLLRAMPEQPWPMLDELALGDLLADAAANRRNVDQLPRLLTLLESSLHYPLDRLFETQAPSTFTVPTGNHIKIDYLAPNGAVLAVRLQELFGLRQTPTIAAGRVRLVLHLLGPNYRPVQITNDLGSFWQTTYFQVRKDLKARYPKHSWPENPLTAPPQAKGRPIR